MTVRDSLAAERTILAYERTVLAYVRTALALLAGGITLIGFFDAIAIKIAGWIVVSLGTATLALGFISYRKMKTLIHKVEKEKVTAPKTDEASGEVS